LNAASSVLANASSTSSTLALTSSNWRSSRSIDSRRSRSLRRFSRSCSATRSRT
jgi:hypothetical protein